MSNLVTRAWRRSPLLHVHWLLTVAVGVGSLAALVSLMRQLGYTPLPYRDPGQLTLVWERVKSGTAQKAISGPDMADFAQAASSAYSELGAYQLPALVWLRDARGLDSVRLCALQLPIFRDLGLSMALGRGPQPGDRPLAGAGVSPVWISYRFWQTRYGGNTAIIGRTISLADTATGPTVSQGRIVGVLPPRAGIPLPFDDSADLWFILRNVSALPRQAALFFGVGRLRPGVTAPAAQAALTVAAAHLGRRYAFERRDSPVVETFASIEQGPARRVMGLLTLSVALVILLACLNVGILTIAEGKRRRHQLAIRVALGARRAWLWRQLAAEKLLLTSLALALGTLYALGLLPVLAHLVPTAGLGARLLHTPPLDFTLLAAFAAVALGAALLWSALLISASAPRDPLPWLSAGAGTSLALGARRAHRSRTALLAVQAAVGIALFAAAALAASAYASRSSADLGPSPGHTALLEVSPAQFPASWTAAQTLAFNQTLLSRLRRLPGTQAVALTDSLPYGFPAAFHLPGDPPGLRRDATAPVAVSGGYFATLGIPMLFGRAFDRSDLGALETPAIINLDMAEHNWPSPQQAIGAQIIMGAKSQTRYRVVGVAENFTGFWLQKPVPAIYVSLSQSSSDGGIVILRTGAPVGSVPQMARQALSGMALPVTVAYRSTMEARWQAQLTRPLARMACMLLLALLGLALSIQGVYAVAAATAEEKRHDLAICSALGAPAGRLAWGITRALIAAVAAGGAAGAALSLWSRPLLQPWLGSATPLQTWPVFASVLLLALAAGAGCYLPARAAARTDPAESLRQL